MSDYEPSPYDPGHFAGLPGDGIPRCCFPLRAHCPEPEPEVPRSTTHRESYIFEIWLHRVLGKAPNQKRWREHEEALNAKLRKGPVNVRGVVCGPISPEVPAERPADSGYSRDIGLPLEGIAS